MLWKGKGMNKTVRIQIHVEIDEEDVIGLLTTAMETPENCGCAWYRPTDQKAYDAKVELISERKPNADDQILHVEVLARMLMNGGTLELLDPESDWHWSGHDSDEMLWKWQIIQEGCEPVGGEWHTVGLTDIVAGTQKYGAGHVAGDLGSDLHKIVEDGDFWDADAVIQYAMYGDLIYG